MCCLGEITYIGEIRNTYIEGQNHIMLKLRGHSHKT